MTVAEICHANFNGGYAFLCFPFQPWIVHENQVPTVENTESAQTSNSLIKLLTIHYSMASFILFSGSLKNFLKQPLLFFGQPLKPPLLRRTTVPAEAPVHLSLLLLGHEKDLAPTSPAEHRKL